MLDALATAIGRTKVNFIVDADIAKFFGSVSQEWLVRFLEHRVGDKRILRLYRSQAHAPSQSRALRLARLLTACRASNELYGLGTRELADSQRTAK